MAKIGHSFSSLVLAHNALDAATVKLAGTQTVTGVKNFTGGLRVNGNAVWHSGNDGAGSGLDADKLDGKQATLFAQHATYNQFSAGGRTSLGNASIKNGYYVNFVSGDGGWARAMEIRNDGAPAGTEPYRMGLLGGGDAYSYAHLGFGTYSGVNNLRIYPDGTLKKGDYTIWHAGNGGAGSGLDADTVDGVQAAAFGKLASTQTWAGTNTFSATSNHTKGVNLGDGQNITWGGTYATGNPTIAAFSNHIAFYPTGNTNGQVMKLTATTLSMLGNTVWHAGNDGSGSTLDADTVDGKHATDFMAVGTASKGFGDTFATGNGGVLRWTRLASFDGGSPASATFAVRGTRSGHHSVVNFIASCSYGSSPMLTLLGNSQYGSAGIHKIRLEYSGTYDRYDVMVQGDADTIIFEATNAIAFVKDVVLDDVSDRSGVEIDVNSLDKKFDTSGTMYSKGSPVHTTANFGKAQIDALSVNAATLGGLAASKFIRNDVNATFAGKLTNTSATVPLTTKGGQLRSNLASVMSMDGSTYAFVTSPSDVHLCHNSYWDGTSWKKYDNAKYSGYIVINSSGLQYRESAAGATNPSGTAHKLWHSGNDGAGSGLDADTLDGSQANDFGRLAGAQTWTKKQTFGVPIQVNGAGKTLTMGSLNGTWCHFETNASTGFYFYNHLEVQSLHSRAALSTASTLSVAGTGTFSGQIAANAGLSQDGHVVLNGADSWIRTKGNDGIFFSDHGGGMYMIDNIWVRTYASKKLLTLNTARDAFYTYGGIQLGGTANYGLGVTGLYSATRFQGVFAMGAAYQLPADGTSSGNLYGIAWTHANNTNAQARKISGHHACFMTNGVTKSAVGDHLWTAGNVYEGGTALSSKYVSRGGWTLVGNFSGADTTRNVASSKMIGMEIFIVGTDQSSTDEISTAYGMVPVISGFASDTNFNLSIGAQDWFEWKYATGNCQISGDLEIREVWTRPLNFLPNPGTQTP